MYDLVCCINILALLQMNEFKAGPEFSASTLGSFKEKKYLNSKGMSANRAFLGDLAVVHSLLCFKNGALLG